ncbi:MAG TPA: hypothetical protein VNQ76_07140 [Planctomicrobium sp.]|nr:hypothetical protein [Planctomicrobium sp.]
MMNRSGFKLVLSALTLMLSVGCQQMFLQPVSAWKRIKQESLPIASAEHPVYEVICMWEPGEGTGLDGLPARGFVGKIMFFAHGINPPVRVNGDVRIYLFDDHGTQEEQQHPIHQFNFDDKAFQTFLTESNLGAAYQLFIPYTRSGTQRATCSLRIRLTSPDSKPVYSKMGTLILPGSTPRAPDLPVGEKSIKVDEGIKLARHETSAPVDVAEARALFDPAALPVRETSEAQSDKMRLKSALSQATQGKALQPAPMNSLQMTPERAPLPELGAISQSGQRHLLEQVMESAEHGPPASVKPQTTGTRLKPAHILETPTDNNTDHSVKQAAATVVTPVKEARSQHPLGETTSVAETEVEKPLRHPLLD